MIWFCVSLVVFFPSTWGQGLIWGFNRVLCPIFCNSLYGICIISSSNGLQGFLVKLSTYISPFCACKRYEFIFCKRGKAVQNICNFSTEVWYWLVFKEFVKFIQLLLILIVYNLPLLKI